GLANQLAARQRAATGYEAVVATVGSADSVAAHCETGGAKGSGGQTARCTHAHRAACVGVVDLELNRSSRRTAGRALYADGSREGQPLAKHRRVGRGTHCGRRCRRRWFVDDLAARQGPAAASETAVATVGRSDGMRAHCQTGGAEGGAGQAAGCTHAYW